MKNLFLILSCLLMLSSAPAMAQTAPDVVVVRVMEDISEIQVMVARNGGPESMITFRAGNTEKEMKSASVGVQKVVQKLYQEGYTLQSTFGGGESVVGTYHYTTSTLIFVKALKP